MYFMFDVFDVVSYLSLVMQKDVVILVEVKDFIECICLFMQVLVVRFGVKFLQFLEVVGDYGNYFKGVEFNR